MLAQCSAHSSSSSTHVYNKKLLCWATRATTLQPGRIGCFSLQKKTIFSTSWPLSSPSSSYSFSFPFLSFSNLSSSNLSSSIIFSSSSYGGWFQHAGTQIKWRTEVAQEWHTSALVEAASATVEHKDCSCPPLLSFTCARLIRTQCPSNTFHLSHTCKMMTRNSYQPLTKLAIASTSLIRAKWTIGEEVYGSGGGEGGHIDPCSSTPHHVQTNTSKIWTKHMKTSSIFPPCTAAQEPPCSSTPHVQTNTSKIWTKHMKTFSSSPHALPPKSPPVPPRRMSRPTPQRFEQSTWRLVSSSNLPPCTAAKEPSLTRKKPVLE